MSSPFRIVPEILFGQGTSEAIAPEARKRGATRALVVADPGLKKPGVLDKVLHLLESGGIGVSLFDALEPEPWVESADRASHLARAEKCNFVMGIGGGSAMDVAKAASVLATNRGKAIDYQGLGKVPKPGLPKMMVPTTAGTGSEVTFTAVLSRKDPKTKAGINSEYLFPQIAILDPALTVSLPAPVTASTGMDALTHAIEAYTCRNSSTMSDAVALAAVRLIARNLPTAVSDGKNMEARSNMLLASLLGGIALANAGVGAAHALAYPLGGMFRVGHGTANGLLISYVMAFNLESAEEKFAALAPALGEKVDGLPRAEAARHAVQAVEKLASNIGVPHRIHELGIPEDKIPDMADAALKVTRPLENNPRPLSRDDAIALYRQAF